MRRNDREVKDAAQIADILRNIPILRIAFAATPAPYVVPVNFGFELKDGQFSLFFHTAKKGRKIDLLKADANVGFEADRAIEISVQNPPCRSTTYFESVIGAGKASLLESFEEKKAGLDVVMRAAGFVGELEYPENSLDAIEIVKIDVAEIVGKRHLPE